VFIEMKYVNKKFNS